MGLIIIPSPAMLETAFLPLIFASMNGFYFLFTRVKKPGT